MTALVACAVCGAASASTLAHRLAVPVLQNAVYTSREEAAMAPRGDLLLLHCDRCGFVWNAAFDPGRISYAVGYENCQSHSLAFREHLKDRIARIAAVLAAHPCPSIVEVGCGQGDFLGLLANLLGPVEAVGFDPSWRGADGAGPASTRVYRQLFDQSTAAALAPDPDIVIARHVIEHMPDPVGFLRMIRAALPTNSTARLFLETPCNQWIRANGAVHDLFYEHCSLFDAGSLAHALTLAGFVPDRVERVFGGQYIWAEATAAATELRGLEPDESFRASWRASIAVARGNGPVAVWGASAKGATFLFLTDPDASLLDCVIDINPAKQGRFIAATGHAIVAPDIAAQRGIGTIIIMNPNYREEIIATARSLGWTPLIHVLD
jgi:SAM-dependent methyltransferase